MKERRKCKDAQHKTANNNNESTPCPADSAVIKPFVYSSHKQQATQGDNISINNKNDLDVSGSNSYAVSSKQRYFWQDSYNILPLNHVQKALDRKIDKIENIRKTIKANRKGIEIHYNSKGCHKCKSQETYNEAQRFLNVYLGTAYDPHKKRACVQGNK